LIKVKALLAGPSAGESMTDESTRRIKPLKFTRRIWKKTQSESVLVSVLMGILVIPFILIVFVITFPWSLFYFFGTPSTNICNNNINKAKTSNGEKRNY
jgi:hypothetical protein